MRFSQKKSPETIDTDLDNLLSPILIIGHLHTLLANSPTQQRAFLLSQGANPILSATVGIHTQHIVSIDITVKNYPQELQNPLVEEAIVSSLQTLAETDSVTISAFRFLFQIKKRIRQLITMRAIPNVRLVLIPAGSQTYQLHLRIDRQLMEAFQLPVHLLSGYAMVSGQQPDRCEYYLSLGISVASDQTTTWQIGKLSLTYHPSEAPFLKVDIQAPPTSIPLTLTQP